MLGHWSDTKLRGRVMGDLFIKAARCRSHSPLRHLPPAPYHRHWGLHRKWCRWLPQSSGSTSFSLISALPHQTSWEKKHLFLNVYPTYDPHALGVYPREVAILGPVSSKMGSGEEMGGSSSSSHWALGKAKKHSYAPFWGIWRVPREQCTHLKFKSLTENLVSMMPVVLTLDRSTSCSLGR